MFKSMYKKIILICAVLLVPFMAESAANPVSSLENAANKVIQVLANHKSELHQNQGIIKQAIQQYILPEVDVSGMSRSVLGRTGWNNANANQRQEFAKLFTDLVIRTYASPLANYKDETISFRPLQAPQGRFAKVSSVIRSGSGKHINLNYSMVLIGNNWKIYDFSVEGVSLIQSFRTQFSQVLNQANMAQLLNDMRTKAQGKQVS